jgi:hypothetical protein
MLTSGSSLGTCSGPATHPSCQGFMFIVGPRNLCCGSSVDHGMCHALCGLEPATGTTKRTRYQAQTHVQPRRCGDNAACLWLRQPCGHDCFLLQPGSCSTCTTRSSSEQHIGSFERQPRGSWSHMMHLWCGHFAATNAAIPVAARCARTAPARRVTVAAAHRSMHATCTCICGAARCVPCACRPMCIDHQCVIGDQYILPVTPSPCNPFTLQHMHPATHSPL